MGDYDAAIGRKDTPFVVTEEVSLKKGSNKKAKEKK
jgi:hypothetical protein